MIPLSFYTKAERLLDALLSSQCSSAFTVFSHTSGIWKCWQADREVLAPLNVCLAALQREQTRLRRFTRTHPLHAAFQTASQLLWCPCWLTAASFLLFLLFIQVEDMERSFLDWWPVRGVSLLFASCMLGLEFFSPSSFNLSGHSLFIFYFFLHFCVTWLSGCTAYIIFLYLK